jgi:DNA repair protein RadC
MKLSKTEQEIVEKALAILESHMRKPGVVLASPSMVRDFLRLRLAGKQYEVFVVIFLDAQHRVIEVVDLFTGTLTQTSVYPREVVRACIEKNAAAVMFAHNHPSGIAQPSRADEMLTRT